MKIKHVVLLALTILVPLRFAVAQGTVMFGTVIFNNSDNGLVMMLAPGQPPQPMPIGGGFVQLAYAPDSAPYTPRTVTQSQVSWLASNSGWTIAGPPVAFTTEPGKFNGGVLTLTGIAAGASIEYVVFGWTGGATFDEVFNSTSGLLGVSSQYFSPTGGPFPTGPAPLANTFGGMIVTNPIPEPSSFALLGIGGMGLFLLRKLRGVLR